MGIPPAVAIGTAKFGGVGVTLGSLWRLRKTDYAQTSYVIPLILITIVATVIGSYILLHINEEILTTIIALILLLSLPFVFLKKEVGLIRKIVSPLVRTIGYCGYFVIVMLQAAFGSGVGTLLPIIMMRNFGLTALEAAATRRIPGLVGSLLSLGIYLYFGFVDYRYGLTMFIGTFIGGWLGTHIAIKQGNEFVKIILACVVIVLCVKLLFFR
jgi:uncharacterized membrane protein YfcA